MGIELELYVLLAAAILGETLFAVFEIETAPWRKLVKWLIVTGGTLALYYAVGHLALCFLSVSRLWGRWLIFGGVANTESIRFTPRHDGATTNFEVGIGRSELRLAGAAT